MINVQWRAIAASQSAVGRVVDELAIPGRTAWPTRAWPPLVLDDGLRVGSRGGHGPIRYAVTAHEPGRRLVMTFDAGCGLDGWHELRVDPGPGRAPTLVHTISARTQGRMVWLWPLAVRWFHEALVHDLFDNAERALTGTVTEGPARWSPWVRVLRRLGHRRSRSRSR